MKYELWDLLKSLKENCEIVDLSHPVSPETPHWSGFEPMEERTVYNFEEDSFVAKEYKIVSQYATHIDAPHHFYEPGRKLHELPIQDTILPLVVIDIIDKIENNPDYGVKKSDIVEFEEEFGMIPEGSFVVLRTDWSKRTENFDNVDDDGVAHFPGWTIEACEYLIKERKVKAIGHEVSDTDATSVSIPARGLPVETYVLSQDIYQVELMRNLDKMPPMGSVILVGFPNVVNAPGFTARCYGFVKKNK